MLRLELNHNKCPLLFFSKIHLLCVVMLKGSVVKSCFPDKTKTDMTNYLEDRFNADGESGEVSGIIKVSGSPETPN